MQRLPSESDSALSQDVTRNVERPFSRQSLSYPFSTATPYPAGFGPVRLIQTHSVDRGEVSNNFRIEMENHVGTHIDGPGHMTTRGPFSQFFSPTGLFLESVLVVDVDCVDSQMVEPKDLDGVAARLGNCELLLLRTGFSRYRHTDPQRYASKNPGISAAFAEFVAKACPRLACIGIDTISFAAMEHIPAGIEAHRILFHRQKPVMLIEDMALQYDLSRIRQVMIIPLFFEGLDSCPCTVIAELDRPA